jgi:hypothetical protein
MDRGRGVANAEFDFANHLAAQQKTETLIAYAG